MNRIAIRITACFIYILFALLVSGCFFGGSKKTDGAPARKLDPNKIKDAVPRIEKYNKTSSYTLFGKRYSVLQSSIGYSEVGQASWYGTLFHGQLTANGEKYDMYKMTAAHKTLPLPSYVRVTNLENNKSTILRVNDRGPFHSNRIIDLSYAAATKLGVLQKGTAKVLVEAIDPRNPKAKPLKKQVLPLPTPSVSSTKAKPTYQRTSDKGVKHLYLQVAALADLSQAQAIQNRLISQTKQQVVIHPLHDNVNDKTIYRVRIGPLESETALNNLQTSTALDSFAKMFAVRE